MVKGRGDLKILGVKNLGGMEIIEYTGSLRNIIFVKTSFKPEVRITESIFWETFHTAWEAMEKIDRETSPRAVAMEMYRLLFESLEATSVTEGSTRAGGCEL